MKTYKYKEGEIVTWKDQEVRNPTPKLVTIVSTFDTISSRLAYLVKSNETGNTFTVWEDELRKS